MGNAGERTEPETLVSHGDRSFTKEGGDHELNLGCVECGTSGRHSLGNVQEAADSESLRFREQLEDREGAMQTGCASLVRTQAKLVLSE